MVSLNQLHLAERICTEYQVGLDDLQTLAEIEDLLKELHPPEMEKEPDNG